MNQSKYTLIPTKDKESAMKFLAEMIAKHEANGGTTEFIPDFDIVSKSGEEKFYE